MRHNPLNSPSSLLRHFSDAKTLLIIANCPSTPSLLHLKLVMDVQQGLRYCLGETRAVWNTTKLFRPSAPCQVQKQTQQCETPGKQNQINCRELRYGLKEPSLAVDPMNPDPGAASQCSPPFPRRLLHVSRAQTPPWESCYAKREGVPCCKLLFTCCRGSPGPPALSAGLPGPGKFRFVVAFVHLVWILLPSQAVMKPCFNFTPLNPTPAFPVTRKREVFV